MARFRGKLLQGGQVVLPAVAGDLLWVSRPHGILSGTGSFPVPGGGVRVGEEYELVLDNGQAWKISIRSMSAGSHQQTVVNFRVQGPA
jgi:hypothetical protein